LYHLEERGGGKKKKKKKGQFQNNAYDADHNQLKTHFRVFVGSELTLVIINKYILLQGIILV